MTRRNPETRLSAVSIYLFFIAVGWGIPTASVAFAAEPVASRAFLWKVEAAEPSWLFGTIHSADTRVATLPENVTRALETSRSFHPEVELSPEAASTLAEKLFPPEGPNLAKQLPPGLWARVKRMGGKLGLPETLLQRLTPGNAALLFAAPPGTEPGATVDGQLYERAVARQLRIRALETIEEQLAIFEQLPQPQAVAALRDMLDEAEAGRPNEAKLLDAYARGDEQAIVEAVEAEFAKSPASRALADPLLYRRNELMAERVAADLRAGGAFAAIGVAHLVGPRSVVELLRAKGFKITRVPQLPRPPVHQNENPPR